MTMLCANINHHVINSVSVDLDPAIRNIQIDIIFPRRSAGMMEDFFFSSLISQQVVAASVLHSLRMIMMISLFMSYCQESCVRLNEGQKCSLLIFTIFHSFFVARGGKSEIAKKWHFTVVPWCCYYKITHYKLGDYSPRMRRCYRRAGPGCRTIWPPLSLLTK